MEFRIEALGIACYNDNIEYSEYPEYRLVYRYQASVAGMFRLTAANDTSWCTPFRDILTTLQLKAQVPQWTPPRAIYSARNPRYTSDGTRVRRLNIFGHLVEIVRSRVSIYSEEGGISGHTQVADISDAITCLDAVPAIPSVFYTRGPRGGLLNLETKEVPTTWQRK